MSNYHHPGYSNRAYRLWPYAVIDTATSERGEFTSMRDVRVFLWGRDLAHYRVERYGHPMAFTRVMA